MPFSKINTIGVFKIRFSLFEGLFLTLFIITAASCTQTSTKPEEYPASGHMSLLSLKEAGKLYQEGNLITNGDFSIWQQGAPAPEGFNPPKNSAISNIVMRDPRGGSGDHSIDQYWNKSDMNEPFLDSFHCLVNGVQAGKIYELTIDARSYDDTTASIYVILLDLSDRQVAFWPDLITINPGKGDINTYTKKIRIPLSGKLIIASKTNVNTKYTGRIIWLAWHLLEQYAIYDKQALNPQPISP